MRYALLWPMRALGALVALLLILPVWMALALGRLDIRGLKEVKAAVRKGKVLIVCNHPSLIETIVLPALFWHWHFSSLKRRVPWSLADERLFGRYGLWFYPSFCCIPVRRTGATPNSFRQTLRALDRTFSEGGSVFLYPEAGRTCKGEEFVVQGERRVRKCNPNALLAAMGKASTIVSVWVDHGQIQGPESMLYGYLKLFFGPRMSVNFSGPMPLLKEHMRADALALLLLETRREPEAMLQPAF